MNIRIVCIGKLKESYWRDAVEEYAKRLSAYCTIEIVEKKESRLPANAGPAEEAGVKDAEGREILSEIRSREYVITLEVKGKRLTSEAFAEKIGNLTVEGQSDLVFVIGGSLGLSPAVSRRADFRMSFSDLTFPHQMMRVILLEQIYRAFRILRNEPYHK